MNRILIGSIEQKTEEILQAFGIFLALQQNEAYMIRIMKNNRER